MNERPSLIKRAARGLLGTHWNTINLAAVVCLGASILSTMLVSRFMPTAQRSAFALISAFAVALILKLLTGLLKAGLIRVALKIARLQKETMGDVFYAVQNQPDRYLVVGVIFTVMELLYILPLIFCVLLRGISTAPEAGFAAVWAFAGAIFLLWFHLTYSLAVPLLNDDPLLGSLDAMKKSAALMRGQRRRLLRLELSFIGWIVLILMSAGFALIWILPYYEESRMLFYLGLVRDDLH